MRGQAITAANSNAGSAIMLSVTDGGAPATSSVTGQIRTSAPIISASSVEDHGKIAPNGIGDSSTVPSRSQNTIRDIVDNCFPTQIRDNTTHYNTAPARCGM